MSTTLVPPTYYEIEQPGTPTRPLETIADLAAVIVRCRPSPKVVVLAVTGRRERRLTGVELRDLARALGALRPISAPPEPGYARRAR